MGTQDPRVDAYITKSADFARPILVHFRELVHSACPDVEETIKWGFPHFLHHGILCAMAAFKKHCGIVFWKGKLVFESEHAEALGQFGRITSVKELPARKTLIGYVKKAMKINVEAKKTPKAAKPKAAKPKKKLGVPKDLAAALARNKKAAATFAGFRPSHRKEYIEWITEAKREETRTRRVGQAIEWMAAGKPRHWKYMDC